MRSLATAFVACLGAAAAASAAPPTPLALLDSLEAAWTARDPARYLSLWSFETPEAEEQERAFVRDVLASESHLVLQRPADVPRSATRISVSAQVVFVSEPRGRVEEWTLDLRVRADGWAIEARRVSGEIGGLVHLSLDPTGYRADGMTLRLEDFTLSMKHGTLYTSPQSLGPTLLVFVGEATVHVSPGPQTERDQLRQFCGKPELVERVKGFLARIQPDDLSSVLEPSNLVPDPRAPGRWPEAHKLYRDNATSAFVLDAPVPGSPWWVSPSTGDGFVTFETRKKGTLTFSINRSIAEGISLTDRRRRLYICLYPPAGREKRYSEDDGRDADILNHDLWVRFEPTEERLTGRDTIRLRLLRPTNTLKLRLDEALAVESITSVPGGRHLFFRVRHQDSVMVSLGALGISSGETELTVRFGGAFSPQPVEHELVQAENPQVPTFSTAPPGIGPWDVRLETAQVFSNRNAWYPQGPTEDYATARLRLETPEGYVALSGGRSDGPRLEDGRVVTEFLLERPAKYLSVAVGRLDARGTRVEGGTTLQAFSVGHLRHEAEDQLDMAAEMIRFYTERFGPCPYPVLNLVFIEGQVPGGHSPPGMVILADVPQLLQKMLRDDPTDFSDFRGVFLAHEIAHQWWGHGVAPENYHERWLSEGAAQYAATLWARHAHGDDVFRKILERMSRWALREADEGPIHLGFRLGHVRGKREIYRAVVYDKGAYVLHMLRGVVGEEAFKKALTAFLQEHRYSKVGTDDLRESLEAASGLDLGPYLREWVYGTKVPVLRFSRKGLNGERGVHGVAVTVAAEGLPGPVPLEITVTTRGGRYAERVTLPPHGGVFEIETESDPRKVEINTDGGLLARVP